MDGRIRRYLHARDNILLQRCDRVVFQVFTGILPRHILSERDIPGIRPLGAGDFCILDRVSEFRMAAGTVSHSGDRRRVADNLQGSPEGS